MDHDAPPPDPLGIVADAAARADETIELAARHLDPSLIDVLRILGFDQQYETARGSHLYDRSGRAYLDFHTGEGFASLGHNHPDVRDVLKATLDAELVDGVQIHYSVLAGMLAESLADRLPARLDAVFFANAGAEAVDSAMKFARAATGRPRLLSCDSSFHGVTLGPLSIVGDEFFKEGFGPLLPGCDAGSVRRPRRVSRPNWPNGTWPRSSSSRSRGGRSRSRPMATFAPPRSCAAVTAPCSCSTRSRPGSVAPGSGSRSSTGASSRTSCWSARRSAAATCRSRRWSPRATSSSGRSARSSAPTCTSRRSGATGCRWPPVWPRCGSSSATDWSSIAQPLARR